MDYGRTNLPTDEPDFFTSGAGTNDENVNSFEASDNLELNNPESSWNQPMTPERDERAIGSKTKVSSELPMPTAEMPTTPKLGEFIDLENAPVPKPFPDESEELNPEHQDDKEDAMQSSTPNLEAIKTTDRLSEEGIKAIENEKQEFIQTGNAEQFYHNVRAKMLPTHMEQSYGANANWGRKAA